MTLLVATIISNMLLLGFFLLIGYLFRHIRPVFYMMLILGGVLFTSSTLLLLENTSGIIYDIIQPISFLMMLSVGFATFIFVVLFLYYSIALLGVSVFDTIQYIRPGKKKDKKIKNDVRRAY